MPFRRTKYDYIFTFFLIIVFLWAFFLGSKWGDLHYTSSDDPASISEVNMVAYLAPFLIIYYMFVLYVLPGKRKLSETPKKLILIRVILMIKKKTHDGIQDYQRWRWTRYFNRLRPRLLKQGDNKIQDKLTDNETDHESTDE